MLLALTLAVPAGADVVKFHLKGEIKEVEGTVVAHDSSDTIMLEGRDSQHFVIAAADRIDWQKSTKPPAPYTKQQLRAALEDEFGPQFNFQQTKNYLICFSCPPEYARQAGALLEKAFSVFSNYFNNKGGFKLALPKQPLVAIVFASREEYVDALTREMGPQASATAGVYMPTTNRMYMYDALGGETGEYLRRPANGHRVETFGLLLQEQNVSTVIHEGIHQIAFNSGFHNRHARNPVWLVEGMATFFEAPDLSAKDGWGGVGNVNRERLEHFLRVFPDRDKNSLERLVLDDRMFRDPRTAHDAYAEAWALTYYFCRAKTKSYVKYLKILNDRPPMEPYPPEDRLRDFKQAFGKSPGEIDLDFRRYMSRVLLK